jgi:hypothetical protein
MQKGLLKHFYKPWLYALQMEELFSWMARENSNWRWKEVQDFKPNCKPYMNFKMKRNIILHGQRSQGCQGKSPFPRTTHDTCYFVVYNFKIFISSTLFILHFRYKYILITNWFYIMYIMHSCPLSHEYEQHLLKSHFWNPHIIFMIKNIFDFC